MPTLPSGRAPDPEPQPHELRSVAESFGIDVERYDRTRPSYPTELLARIIDHGPGRTVLDVGCGTGILARQLQAAGCTVTGVEPDARMAALARRSGVPVEIATLEEWDPADASFDVVVAGQAWHWVDPVAGAAKAARVLRPGGLLAVLWNVMQPPPEVTDAFATAYRRVAPDSSFAVGTPTQDAYRALTDKAIDGLRQAGGFAPAEQWHTEWDQHYDRAAWLDQLPTHGALTTLGAERQAEVVREVGAAIEALGGSMTVHYTTVALTAVRTAVRTGRAYGQA
ncbi:class I SAM-dependent methyltransferase [Streptomyces sp. HSW2009]|uniref:class I SAM-dependent methyltransferase n=1 Tax=Streptomyces sp. HSW2009 TaxID=3142890 RepID=UPI0032EB00DE